MQPKPLLDERFALLDRLVMLATLVAVIHLAMIPLGVALLILRASALAAAERPEQLKRVLLWDNLYAGAALLWVGSGLLRAFAGLEKGSAYYLANHAFWGKMLLLAVVLGAEAVPMVAFIRLRVRMATGQAPSLERKGLLLRMHWVELFAIVGMVVMAVLMSRGIGVVRPRAARTSAVSASSAADLAVARGAHVYQRFCETCHQADGRGINGKLAADFVGDASRLAKTDAQLALSIKNGVPNTAMRAFGPVLDDAQIHDVLAFIRERFAQRAPAH